MKRLWSQKEFVAEHFNLTAVLTFALTFVWFVMLCLSLAMFRLPFYAFLPIFFIQLLVVFLMFTPIHEATHFNISKKRWLNELCLLLCWPIFLANPILFRRIHLQHHSKTNHDEEDPDHFTAHPSLALRVFKSFFLLTYYHYFFFKNWKTWRWTAHGLLSLLSPLFVCYIALMTPFGTALFWAWILPTFVGVGLLSFANTAWPHHPAKSSDRLHATRIHYVPWLLQVIMLNQNLHLVHHLRPKLSWYQYPDFVRENEQELKEKGVTIVSYTKRDEPFEFIPTRAKELIDKLMDQFNGFIS